MLYERCNHIWSLVVGVIHQCPLCGIMGIMNFLTGNVAAVECEKERCTEWAVRYEEGLPVVVTTVSWPGGVAGIIHSHSKLTCKKHSSIRS